ncbi:MAG: TatD family hydrolase [Candidatus Shapirobacteria bacterium]|nr:TatD family hydrolase [Candidatus Shapirobacteria bacterium]
MLVDTHAHLNFPDFKDDLDEVIKRSVENDVKKIICVSSNLADSAKAIEIAKKYPGVVYAAVGIHPHQTNPQEKLTLKEQIKELNKLAQAKEVIAIGECGLDFSPAPPIEKDRPEKEQIFLFEKQIELALSLNLPVSIHSRKAFDEVFAILKKYFHSSKGKLKGVVHCYSGSKSDIKKIEEIGFYFGLDGNLTYDLGLQNVAKLIPLEKILLETDCPFLFPEPYCGLRNEAYSASFWRNEPKNVRIIAEFLAQLKGLTLNQLAKIFTKNTYAAFFGKTR